MSDPYKWPRPIKFDVGFIPNSASLGCGGCARRSEPLALVSTRYAIIGYFCRECLASLTDALTPPVAVRGADVAGELVAIPLEITDEWRDSCSEVLATLRTDFITSEHREAIRREAVARRRLADYLDSTRLTSGGDAADGGENTIIHPTENPSPCPDCQSPRYWEKLSGGGVDSVCLSCGRRGANDDLTIASTPAPAPAEQEDRNE